MLKKKIFKAKKSTKPMISGQNPGKKSYIDPPFRVQFQNTSYSGMLQNKNLFKNYGRAICNFIASRLSDPYLEILTDGLEIERDELKCFVQQKKKFLAGIHEFIYLLEIQKNDSDRVACFKRLITKLSEIFIKYFAVNWIIHGKLQYKLFYLKSRQKILRNIRLIHNSSLMSLGKSC